MDRITHFTTPLLALALVALLGGGCDVSEDDTDISAREGAWGHATECKEIPDLEPLAAPEIHISIHGLTLRLTDETSGFDKVYPVGVGSINLDPYGTTYEESLTHFPLLYTGSQDFEITPSTTQSCKIWWTDDSGNRVPVFAGLPFLGWWGNYGIHGPITDYTEPDGGNLKRGFVSHGCIRMESADILELTALIRGVASVPVHVQREAERRSDGQVVDTDDPWLGAECDTDDDCSFEGGFCKDNPVGGRGFCSAHCERYCEDRYGSPVSFCVDDPDDDTQGMCVLKEQSQNHDCRNIDHAVPQVAERFGEPWKTATVCLPGSRGWVGDRCLSDGDCFGGNHCEAPAAGEPGVCTQGCTHYCPDQPGFPWTYCVDDEIFDGPTCLRECTPESNGSECPAGHACEQRTGEAPGNPVKYACVPEVW